MLEGTSPRETLGLSFSVLTVLLRRHSTWHRSSRFIANRHLRLLNTNPTFFLIALIISKNWYSCPESNRDRALI